MSESFNGVAPELREDDENSYTYELERVEARIGRKMTLEEEQRFFENGEAPGDEE